MQYGCAAHITGRTAPFGIDEARGTRLGGRMTRDMDIRAPSPASGTSPAAAADPDGATASPPAPGASPPPSSPPFSPAAPARPATPSAAASGLPLLAARGLCAAYGDRVVLRDIHLRIDPGTLTALIGPNGSGKSTLLHALCGILPGASGEVILDGRPLRAHARREIARRVALVEQAGETVPGISVEEAVALGRYPWMGPLAPPSAEDRAQVEAAMQAMDVHPLRFRRLETLSGGERQRVLLARALAQSTPILLLDEPAANLDLRYQQEIFERLRRLVRSRGVAVLVAEHQINLVAAACDRILVLHEGRLAAEGPPGEIVTESLLCGIFGARMRVERDAQGRPQCLWAF